MTKTNKGYMTELHRVAAEILGGEKMQLSKTFIQHGSVSVYEHSVAVAVMCLKLADRFHARIDRRSLIRGALLHDYFLYDWHDGGIRIPPHGFTHAGTALKDARREFRLNKVERDMIWCHMFPLNLTRLPRYRESAILCIADKIIGTKETIGGYAEKLKKKK